MNLVTSTTLLQVGGDFSRDRIEAIADSIADALYDLEQERSTLLDSSVGADLDKGSIEITVTVAHAGLPEGQAVAESAINTAIQRSGGLEEDTEQDMVPTHQESSLVLN